MKIKINENQIKGYAGRCTAISFAGKTVLIPSKMVWDGIVLINPEFEYRQYRKYKGDLITGAWIIANTSPKNHLDDDYQDSYIKVNKPALLTDKVDVLDEFKNN